MGLGGPVGFSSALDLHDVFLCFTMLIQYHQPVFHARFRHASSHVFAHATYGQALYVMQPTPGRIGLECLGLSWPCMSVLVSKKCIAVGHANMKYQECIEYPTP